MSHYLLFLDVGGPELALILFAALMLFGGDKLPELAKGLGKGIRDFKDASNGVKKEVEDSIKKLEDDQK
jgi:sec-independent protein translocase protein TatA